MQIGNDVECLVNRDPLKKGDRGTVIDVNRLLPYPITVYFPGVKTSFPMKESELK